jgi:hypothetical protein
MCNLKNVPLWTDANAEAIRTEARQYLSVAKGLYKRKKFNNQAITNIICLSAEQCMVSFFNRKRCVTKSSFA